MRNLPQPPITDLQDWFAALAQTSTLVALAALTLCAVLAWLLTHLVAKVFASRERSSVMFGQRLVDGVMFPAAWLCLAWLARQLLSHSMTLVVFKIAIPVLLSLLLIRIAVKVLRAAFSETPAILLLEHTISWIAWLAVVLWVSGVLPLLLEELDQITWMVGNSQLSVRKLIEGALTAGLVLIVSLWISSAIESKLLRSATGAELSLRMAVSNASRALLMLVGLLVALSAVGIDLTALSVLGGAIGVGIGFGLQKLAANYVSGFVILAERSMRIGDSVQVDGFTGVITQINARYTVIRSLAGREAIVPNELLITNRVENFSLADKRIWQSTSVSVGYDSDVELVLRLLTQAATQQPRVLSEPAPAVTLSNFAADGLEFTLGYWIADPENGSMNIKSQINLEILRLLRQHHIDIPYPQRVLHHAK